MTVASEPSNPHLADTNLKPFLSNDFSAVDYLNDVLPSYGTSKQPSPSAAPTLSTLASQTQSHVSTLSAQTSRLSATLTSLTDDILRTGSRLAYEVELLRGEAISLAETLSASGPLDNSIRRFVPGGLDRPSGPEPHKAISNSDDKPMSVAPTVSPATADNEPTSLPRLRTLLHVRSQLQSTIQTFNVALSFPFPPSLLNTGVAAFVSISAPTPSANGANNNSAGGSVEAELEAKGQAALARLKGEVTDLLAAGEADKADARVAELRDVCRVWKGTGEEKARLKWVDGLEALVEEDVRKRSERERERDARRNPPGAAVGTTASAATAASSSSSSVGRAAIADGERRSGTPTTGFLRRLRDEIYAE